MCKSPQSTPSMAQLRILSTHKCLTKTQYNSTSNIVEDNALQVTITHDKIINMIVYAFLQKSCFACIAQVTYYGQLLDTFAPDDLQWENADCGKDSRGSNGRRISGKRAVYTFWHFGAGFQVALPFAPILRYYLHIGFPFQSL